MKCYFFDKRYATEKIVWKPACVSPRHLETYHDYEDETKIENKKKPIKTLAIERLEFASVYFAAESSYSLAESNGSKAFLNEFAKYCKSYGNPLSTGALR